MKLKVTAVLLLLAMSLTMFSCGEGEKKELSCEEIIKAYENAGYTVQYHNHRDANTDSDVICNIQIVDPQNAERNYLYIDRYANEEKAKAVAEEYEYHLAIWMIAVLHGEGRWLKSRQYGNIHYHSYNKKILKPLESLMG